MKPGPETLGYLQFEGRQIPVLAGDTVAACLARAGVVAFRQTRRGEPRGMYCGIGVCNDCLVTVGDERNVRACVTEARPGSVVSGRSELQHRGDTAAGGDTSVATTGGE